VTSYQSIHPDYVVGFDTAPVRLPPKQVDSRIITVHWIEAGQVTRTTEETWSSLRPILKTDVTAVIRAGEIWWSEDGGIRTKPPQRGGKQ